MYDIEIENNLLPHNSLKFIIFRVLEICKIFIYCCIELDKLKRFYMSMHRSERLKKNSSFL